MKKATLSGLAASLIGGAQMAQAAVDSGVATAFTSMTTDFSTVMGYAYTAGAIVVGGSVIFGIAWKLLKRVGSKA